MIQGTGRLVGHESERCTASVRKRNITAGTAFTCFESSCSNTQAMASRDSARFMIKIDLSTGVIHR